MVIFHCYVSSPEGNQGIFNGSSVFPRSWVAWPTFFESGHARPPLMAPLTRSTRPLMKSEREPCRSNTETMIRDSMVGFYGILWDFMGFSVIWWFYMVLLCLTGRYYEYSGILLDSIVVLWGSIWFIGDLSGTFIAWSTKGFIVYQGDVTSKHDGYKYPLVI